VLTATARHAAEQALNGEVLAGDMYRDRRP
jgi:hypothetical protein